MGEGVCLICLICMVVNLLTGFQAFVPPVKDFTHGISVVVMDVTSIVQMLKFVGVSTVQ